MRCSRAPADARSERKHSIQRLGGRSMSIWPVTRESSLELLRDREASETALTNAYRLMAETTKDSGVRFIIKHILADEEHHAALVAAVAEAPTGDPNPDWIPPIEPDEGAALLAETHRFLKLEREGLHELRRLRRASRQDHGDAVKVLLRILEADTRKHIALLEYVIERLV